MILQGRFKHFYQYQQRGMVLFHTLLMMTLITGLILSQIAWINLLWQSLSQLKIKHQTSHQLEQVAVGVMKSQIYNTNNEMSKIPQDCTINEAGLDEVQTRLESGKGCVLQEKNQQYRYLYEELNDFPCMQTKREGKSFGTKHWRLSLLALGDKTMMIQIRVAVISEGIIPCRQEKVTYIDTGMLSWLVI